MPARYQDRFRYLLSCDRPEARAAGSLAVVATDPETATPSTGEQVGHPGLDQGSVPRGAGDRSQFVSQRCSSGARIGKGVVLGHQPGDWNGSGRARQQAQRLHGLHGGAIRPPGPLLVLTTTSQVSVLPLKILSRLQPLLPFGFPSDTRPGKKILAARDGRLICFNSRTSVVRERRVLST